MGETSHIPVSAAICRRHLGNPYKLQTQLVWLTLNHPVSAPHFGSRAGDGEPNGTICGPPEATVPPRDRRRFTAALPSTFPSPACPDCAADSAEQDPFYDSMILFDTGTENTHVVLQG